MVSYIRSVYGSPVGAWNSELTRGWYDRGGWLPTGASIAINKTGQPERVLSPAESAGGGGQTLQLSGSAVATLTAASSPGSRKTSASTGAETSRHI